MFRSNAMSLTVVFVSTATLAGPVTAGITLIEMQVAFEDIPGGRQLDAGDLERGISITEAELKSSNPEYRSELLANLCGAYVLTREIKEARHACDAAVESGAKPSAFNNRGVLRVLVGDLEGARRDFARIRPDDVEAYIDELKRTDPRFMASENLSLLDEVEKRVAIARGDAPLALDIPVEGLSSRSRSQ